MSDLSEIKSLLDQQGRAFEEFKTANDALIKAKAEGKALGDLEARVAKLNEAIEAYSEKKDAIDDLLVKAARPGGIFGGDAKDAEAKAAELKAYNDQRRAHAQLKGMAFEPMQADAYVHFKSAVLGMVRHGSLDRLSADERKAMSAGSDPDGGFLLPASTVGRTVAKVYEQSTMRQLATVQPVSTDAMEGLVDNDQAGAGWVGETSARNETSTPNLGQYRVEVHEMYAEPRATQKLLDDAAVDVEAWLAGKVADRFARLEGAAFWQGSGVSQPRGIASYSTAATGDDSRAWGVFEHVNTGANGAFHTTKADPLQDLIGAFRDNYLQNATFVMRREVRTAIRKLKEATSDRYLWEPSLQAGVPDRLLGYPVRVDQYLPALATGSLSLAFGDFREAYQILDRIGIRVLRDPYTAKPYIKFYTTRRVGGAAVNFEAVKFLRFSA